MSRFEDLDHEGFMREALAEAEKALVRGDRPIGAVIVRDGQVVARGSNTFRTDHSHIAHAEMNALSAGADYVWEYQNGCTIYTTVEPCVMCLGAIVNANIRNIVFGLPDNNIRTRDAIAAVEYIRKRVHNYVGGVLEDECLAVYRRFSEDEARLMLTGSRC